MLFRAYRLASADTPDANSALEALQAFIVGHGRRIASIQVKKASGTPLDRRELLRLLTNAKAGKCYWWRR